MWWLKNCWSFSLTKLMEICSKPLYSKISKPAMSSTAQKFAFYRNDIYEYKFSLTYLNKLTLSVGSMRVLLHLTISHLKRRSKMALHI